MNKPEKQADIKVAKDLEDLAFVRLSGQKFFNTSGS